MIVGSAIVYVIESVWCPINMATLRPIVEPPNRIIMLPLTSIYAEPVGVRGHVYLKILIQYFWNVKSFIFCRLFLITTPSSPVVVISQSFTIIDGHKLTGCECD